MQDKIQQYIEYLKTHGRKQLTISDYETKLRLCERALEKAGLPTDPEQIGEREMFYLRDHLLGSEYTVRRKLSILDQCIKWNTGKSVLVQMDMLWNRQIERRRVFIGNQQYATLLKAAKPWERLVLILGGMMGLRRQEMVDIRLPDISSNSIRIHGKGHGSGGLVANQPMPDGVPSEIERYLSWRRTQATSDNYLLIVPDGKQHGGLSGRKYLAQNISRMIARLGRRLGIEITTHSLRRFFGTSVYEISGGDLDLTMRLMRHADPRVTLECYIQPNESKKRKTIDSLSMRFL